MNNALKVFLFEFKNKFHEKSIIISAVIMIFMIFAATFIPSFINQDKTEEDVTKEQKEVMKKVGYIIDDINIEKFIVDDDSPLKLSKKYNNKEDLIKDIEDKKLNVGFVVLNETEYKIYRSGSNFVFSMMDNYGIEESLSVYSRNMFYKKNNINPEVVKEAENIKITSTVENIGKSAENNYFIAYIGVFVIYIIIIMFGVAVSTSIAREKNDRTMELLITTTSSTSLIVGKVIASLLFSVGQIIVMLLAGFLGVFINKTNYPENFLTIITQNISLELIIVFLIFSFFGCLLYFFIYAALGSLVSRVEDVNNAIGPIQTIFVVAFMISTIGMNTPSSLLIKISSFIPFTSPMAMFVRYSMTEVPIIDLIISLMLLFITTVILANISIKIYRQATLNYGNKLSLLKVIKSIR